MSFGCGVRAVACAMLALLVFAGGPAGASDAGSGERIPAVKGTTFAGQAVELPKDLQGKAGVLVVGFSQGSRAAVTEWGKRLAVDYYGSPTVAYYEMPVLAGVPRLLRGWVTGKIKDSVSERGKVHFLPVLENEEAWRTAVHYKGSDDAYVLVVDGQGRVRWQTQGGFSEGLYEVVKEQVAAAQR